LRQEVLKSFQPRLTC